MSKKPESLAAYDNLPRTGMFWTLLSITVWFAIVVAHFFLCALFAHWLGSPNKLPAALKSLDELLTYSISSFLELLLGLVWMAIVVVTLLALGFVAFLIQEHLPRAIRSAVIDGMVCILPVAGITLMTLLILPFYSHNLVQDPSGLELAEALPFDDFLELLLAGLFSMLAIIVLFAGMFLAVMLFMTFLPDGGVWQLIAAILFGIVCSMVFGFVVGPYVLKLSDRIGAVRAIVAFLGGWAVITSVPIMVFIRAR